MNDAIDFYVDTSGSMSDETLRSFFEEVKRAFYYQREYLIRKRKRHIGRLQRQARRITRRNRK